MLSAPPDQRGQRTTAIGRGLYAPRLTDGPTSYIFARKEVHPYYGRKNDPPLTVGTQQLYLRTQGSVSLSSLTAVTHLVEA